MRSYVLVIYGLNREIVSARAIPGRTPFMAWQIGCEHALECDAAVGWELRSGDTKVFSFFRRIAACDLSQPFGCLDEPDLMTTAVDRPGDPLSRQPDASA